jgi:hypothetical protein
MSAKWLPVLAIVVAGCGSQADLQTGTVESTNVGVTATMGASTKTGQVTDGTTPGTVSKQVEMEATLPSLDGPATLWRSAALPEDPDRVARWARAFGFTDEEIGAATSSRVVRDTPDGQVLSISEPTGQWVFVDGPAGMYAIPGSCPLPGVAPSSLPSGQCADPPPPGVPDPPTAEQQARSLWQALGIDLTGVNVTVGGNEYLREVVANDDLDGVVAARLRVVIGVDGRVMRATGSIDAPVAAGSVARVGVVDALDEFARQPPSGGPDTNIPDSFDGTYRVTGATAGLVMWGGQWLVPSYDISLADGRTITLLAIDPNDIPAS